MQHKHTVMRPVVPTDANKPKPRVIGGQQKKTAQVDCVALEQLIATASATTPTASVTTPMPVQQVEAPRFAHTTKKRAQTGPVPRPQIIADGSQALPLVVPTPVAEIELEAEMPPSPTAPTTRMEVIADVPVAAPPVMMMDAMELDAPVPELRARRWPLVVALVGVVGVAATVLALL